jgi:hypothetical protein
LTDDHQAEGAGHEQEHRQQPRAGARKLAPQQRPDDLDRGVVFANEDPERDERKRAEPLNGSQPGEQRPADALRQNLRRQPPPAQSRAGFRKRLGG